jgi:hypothetical protein
MSNLYTAMLAAQMDMPSIPKTKINPYFKSKYAPLDEVYAQVVPILNKHGLVYVENVDATLEGQFLIAAIIHAESGVRHTGSYPLVPEKNTPQGMGIAITYARRYLLQCMTGVTPEEDTDGEGLRGESKSTPDPDLWDSGQPTGQLPNVQDPAMSKAVPQLWKETRDTMSADGMGDFLIYMREKHVGSKRNCTEKQYGLVSGLVDAVTGDMHSLVLSVLAGESISGETLIGGDLSKILIDTLYKKSDSYDEAKAAKMAGNLRAIASRAEAMA